MGLLDESGVTSTEPESLLSELVGEGKKFKDAETLAKSRVDADKHITQIESENEEMRKSIAEMEQSLAEQDKMKALIEQLNSKPTEGVTEGDGVDNQTASEPEDIKSLVEQAISEREASKSSASNISTVEASILAYAKNDEATARALLDTQLSQLGMDKEQFKTLSETSPSAALALVGVTQVTSKIGSPTSVSTTNSGGGLSEPRRNKAWYTAKKKEMGYSKYYSDIALQTQFTNDHAAQGDDFFK